MKRYNRGIRFHPHSGWASTLGFQRGPSSSEPGRERIPARAPRLWPGLGLALLWALLSFTPPAKAQSEADFAYAPDGAGLVLTGYTGPGGEVAIPEVLGGRPVTRIAASTFRRNFNVTRVTIPDSVGGIDPFAFADCVGLTNVTLPSGLSVVSEGAFTGCASLRGVTIPEGTTAIGKQAFLGCASLTSVVLPNSLTNLEYMAFYACANLTQLNIPASVTHIGQLVFSYCRSLQAITASQRAAGTGPSEADFTYAWDDRNGFAISGYLGAGGAVTMPEWLADQPVISIGAGVFQGNRGITRVTIPENVGWIDAYAFADCTGLTNLALSSGLGVVGNGAFRGCTGLTAVTIPEWTTEIGQEAFSGCTRLTNVTLPDGLLNIGVMAFYSCASLTRMNIPASVTRIERAAFSFCGRLQAFTVDERNPTYASRDGMLISRAPMDLIAVPGGQVGNCVVPQGVTRILMYTFDGCGQIAQVIVPASVNYLGNGAFLGCVNLLGVYFEGRTPDVGDIPWSVFDQTTNVVVYGRTGNGWDWAGDYCERPKAYYTPAPSYAEWAQSIGLPERYPSASGERDDPDHDGLSNLAEMRAGTDPLRPESRLVFEPDPRPGDLAEADRTPLLPSQLARYFQSVPGKVYQVLRANTLDGGWQAVATFKATATQKRVLLDPSAPQGYFQILAVPAP